jgi:hypothetical protein
MPSYQVGDPKSQRKGEAKIGLSDEPTVGKFHDVGDEEADKAIESMQHSIPHNEAIGRVLRNMYGRLQKLEDQVKKPKRGSP